MGVCHDNLDDELNENEKGTGRRTRSCLTIGQLEIMGDNPATVDFRKDLFDAASQSKYIRGMILRYWKTPVAGFVC